MASHRKRDAEVIDLLWDDSDDDEKPPATKKVAPVKKPRKAAIDYDSKPAAKVATTTNSSHVSSRAWQVATYNVWFGPPTGPLHSEERMLALTQCLVEKHTPERPLLFIGLQEVTPELVAVLQPVLESAGYKFICQDLSMGGYGVALAVLETAGIRILSYGWQPYRNTIMSRGFLHARAQLPNSSKQIVFTTTHLESFVKDGPYGQTYTGAPEREQQILELEQFIHNTMKRYPDIALAMMSGDLNWDDERPKSAGTDKVLLEVLSDKSWKDPWFDIREQRRQASAGINGKVKKKDEPTLYTYDGKESPMLTNNLRRRFDRILVRHQSGVNIHVDDLELIGKEPIEGLQWDKVTDYFGRVTRKLLPVLPSDHFGLMLSINATGLN